MPKSEATPDKKRPKRPLLWGFDLSRLEHHYRSFVISEAAFSPEECDRIVALGEQAIARRPVDGEAGSGVHPDIRKSTIAWLQPSESAQLIYRRIERIAVSANDKFFRFLLMGMGEPVQFARYGAGGDHYGWHQDIGEGPPVLRKLSIVVLLSEPDAYEGGELEIRVSDRISATTRKRGAMVLFPSWQLHRVTPVTGGLRYSLACWLSGEPFR